MTPKDLKTGMVVQTRKEGLYLVLRDTEFTGLFLNLKDVIWRDPGFWMPLDAYLDDFTVDPYYDADDFIEDGADEEQLKAEAKPFDIVAVAMPMHPTFLQMNRLKEMPDVKLLWTAKDGDLEDMTLSWYRSLHPKGSE